MTVQMPSAFLRLPTRTRSGLALFDEISCGMHHAMLDVAVTASFFNYAVRDNRPVSLVLLRSWVPKAPSQAHHWRTLMPQMGQPKQAADGVMDLLKILALLAHELEAFYNRSRSSENNLDWQRSQHFKRELANATRAALTALRGMREINARISQRYFFDNEEFLLRHLMQVKQEEAPFMARNGNFLLPVMPRPRPASTWTCKKPCIVESKGKEFACSAQSLSEIAVLCSSRVVPDIGSAVVVELNGTCNPGTVVWRSESAFDVKFAQPLDRTLLRGLVAA